MSYNYFLFKKNYFFQKKKELKILGVAPFEHRGKGAREVEKQKTKG
jgi:hypothetical protein